MLFEMVEFGKFVEIAGYRNVAFIQAEGFLKANRKQPQSVDIQFFDADLIATPQHLYFATLNALQAFKGKTNISKTPAMETMLYASAQRQIQKAIDRSGIKPQTTNMAVIIIGEDPKQVQAALEAVSACVGKDPDETVLELTQRKEERIKKAFEITDEEIKTVATSGKREKAIVDLVIERIALLATQF